MLLDINPEGELFRQINDIVDELFLLVQIKIQEVIVTRNFVKQVQQLMLSPRLGEDDSTDNRSWKGFQELKRPIRPALSSRNAAMSRFDRLREPEEDSQTMINAVELLDTMANQLAELEHLKVEAENTSSSVCMQVQEKHVTKSQTVERSTESKTTAGWSFGISTARTRGLKARQYNNVVYNRQVNAEVYLS
jgi:hypothetical protein